MTQVWVPGDSGVGPSVTWVKLLGDSTEALGDSREDSRRLKLALLRV